MRENLYKSVIILFLWHFAAHSKAQDSCVFLLMIPQNTSFATADHLSNTYLVNGYELQKYDSTGQFVSRYSNNRLGRVGFVDATNPLKILIWYTDFQTAVFLDRNLTELGRLNLAEAGYPAVRCLASSADGKLWAYDEARACLLKLSTSGEKLLESQPLSLEFTQQFSPTCIRDDGSQAVYLSDPGQGIAVFNAFAQFDKTLLFKGLVQFEAKNGILCFLEAGSLRLENWRGFGAKKLPLPWTADAGVTGIWLSPDRLFAQTPYGIAVYGFD